MLKFKVAKIEDVPEEFRQLYAKGEDGSYYLAVEGAVPKDRLDEFRQTNVDLMKRLENFKDVDPAKYRELMDQHRKLSEKKLIEEGKVEELINQRVQAMKQDFDTQLSARDTELTTARRQLEVLLIDNSVRDSAAKIGVAPTAVEDVLLRAKTVFQIKDGKPVAMRDGQVVYGRDGQNSISIGDWLSGLKDSAPHLFNPSTGSGAKNHVNGGTGNTAPKSAQAKIAAGLQNGSSSILS